MPTRLDRARGTPAGRSGRAVSIRLHAEALVSDSIGAGDGPLMVLSAGAAARLAGVPEPVFLAKLGDYGVDTFHLTREDLEGERSLG